MHHKPTLIMYLLTEKLSNTNSAKNIFAFHSFMKEALSGEKLDESFGNLISIFHVTGGEKI